MSGWTGTFRIYSTPSGEDPFLKTIREWQEKVGKATGIPQNYDLGGSCSKGQPLTSGTIT